MAATPRGKRVKTHFLGGGVDGKISLATTETHDNALVNDEAWQPQDDVTIIGASCFWEADIRDAHTNADGEAKGYVEITRASRTERDAVICRVEGQLTWNAAIVCGGGSRTQATVMLPAGYGIDVDEGETVSLMAYLSWIGGGGDLDFFCSGIIYYVEQ